MVLVHILPRHMGTWVISPSFGSDNISRCLNGLRQQNGWVGCISNLRLAINNSFIPSPSNLFLPMAQSSWHSQPVTTPPSAYVTGPQGSLLPVYNQPPPPPPYPQTGYTTQPTYYTQVGRTEYITCDHGESRAAPRWVSRGPPDALTGHGLPLAFGSSHKGHGQDYEMECTLCGILCCVFLFPFGIICALLMREKRCRRCELGDWLARGEGWGVTRTDCCTPRATDVQAINSCSRCFWVVGLLGCWVTERTRVGVLQPRLCRGGCEKKDTRAEQHACDGAKSLYNDVNKIP
jgi:hypothetical protein